MFPLYMLQETDQVSSPQAHFYNFTSLGETLHNTLQTCFMSFAKLPCGGFYTHT